MTGLYIHIPFCRARCHFCAFYLEMHRADKAHRYLEALVREIRLHAERDTLAGRPLETVYFGGGTPTALDADQLSHILSLVREGFGLKEDAEISLEAHPAGVTEAGLRRLIEAGFTRISFGAQSMDDRELLSVGRHWASDAVRSAVRLARRAGFTNINLDLIYGLPGQTRASWQATLREAIALGSAHLSCYALTVEEHTRLDADIRRSEQPSPDPELQNWMEAEAARTLSSAGFERYEISNYSQPGRACRHNLLYWTGQDYLGLGPSAQSYLDGARFGTVEDLEAYIQALDAGRLPLVQSESLTPVQRRREALVFGLRLIQGVASDPADEPDAEWSRTVERLIEQGLLEERMGRLTLTEHGRRYADTVAVELL